MTQIMNLLNLAPDIQEEILFMPKTMAGRDPVSERSIRRVTAVVRWDRQRKVWRGLLGEAICKKAEGGQGLRAS